MLIHLQFPIVDLRGLTQRSDSGVRLSVPNWPTPLMDEEFIRSTGIIRKRWRGGLNGWAAEDRYCDARRSITFDAKAFKQAGLNKWQFKIAFRRFYFDGISVAKFEIGLASDRKFESSKDVFEELLRKLLGMTVRVRRPGTKFVDCQLFGAGQELAKLYASSSNKHSWRGPRFWVNWKQRALKPLIIAGTPAIFIDVNNRQVAPSNIPNLAREFSMKEAGLKLFHWWAIYNGRSFHIWSALHSGYKYHPETRKLRIFLLRLNAENQALTRVLKAINSDQIKPEPRSSASDVLQNYLNDVTSNILTLSAKSREFAANDAKFFALVAAAADESISPTERQSMLSSLEDLKIRKNIFRKIESQETLQVPNAALGLGESGNRIVLNANTINIGGFHMPTLSQQQQLLLAFAFGAIVLSFLLVVALFIPVPSQYQEMLFRIAISLAASGIGAVIPGFLNLQLKFWGQVAVRAGGALAIFVIIYFFNPGALSR